MSSSPVCIHVMTQDPAVIKAVRNAISATERKAMLRTYADLAELGRALEVADAHLALVDTGADADSVLSDLELVISRFPETRFAVLASELRQSWLLRAMQAGARHFIGTQDLEAELHGVLAQTRAVNPSLAGSIVTVLSAGGGCGATTLAVNLTDELYRIEPAPTLLIDLDCARGSAAGQLGLSAQYGIADVLGAGERLDTDLIRSSAVQYGSLFHVLASPATVDLLEPAPLEWRSLDRALTRTKDSFRNTVIDAPRVSIDVAETLVRASAHTILAFEMNVEDLRVARIMLAALLRRGIGPDRILPVANRHPARKSQIRLDEARKALGVDTIRCLSNDYVSVARSINYGRTLTQIAPRSAIRRDIRELAVALRGQVQHAVSA